MKYDIVIFDLDGTILDTLEDLTISMNAALSASGLPCRSADEVRQFVGNGIPKAVERAAAPVRSPEKIGEVLSAFTCHYQVHCADHTIPYPGITELLKKLKQAGALLGVISNKADYAVQELCDRLFPDLFDSVVGMQEGMQKKPHPDGVNKALKDLSASLQTHRIIYIGDSEVDIATARNAGLDVILVSWGFRDPAFLAAEGAEQIVDTAQELEQLLSINDTELDRGAG